MPSDLFSYDTSPMIGERNWLSQLTPKAGRILQIGNKWKEKWIGMKSSLPSVLSFYFIPMHHVA